MGNGIIVQRATFNVQRAMCDVIIFVKFERQAHDIYATIKLKNWRTCL